MAGLRDRLAAVFLSDPFRVEGSIDFAKPDGEPALLPPESIAWRVMRSPFSLFVGGVTVVILELAEPRMAAAWEHSNFRTHPARRLRRTGYAALVTVYGPRSAAEALVESVRRRHDRVQGITSNGEAYTANDPQLLNWVSATLAYGLAEAYHAYVRPLSREGRDRLLAELAPIGGLYGATAAPCSVEAGVAAFAAMRGRLQRSEALFAFLPILHRAPFLPPMLRPLQSLLIRGAVERVPPWLRDILGLDRRYGLPPGGAAALRRIGRFTDRIVLPDAPAVRACRRLGLPMDYLFDRDGAEVGLLGDDGRVAAVH